MAKKIKFISWEAVGGADGIRLYRLDKPRDAERFFKELAALGEYGDEIVFSEATVSEWRDIILDNDKDLE